MTDAPERIWVWEHYDDRDRAMGLGEWYTAEVGLDGDETEYVRADIHAALTAELDALRGQVEALQMAIANHAAEACGLLKAHNYQDGTRLWNLIRAALKGSTNG